MTTALEAMRSCYEFRDRAARDWKEAGGRVVGYLCDQVPVELIIAAGMLPYRLSADPTSGSASLKQYVEPFVQQPLATPGYVASMEHLVLSGDYDFVDYLVIPNGKKSIQAFYRDFITAKAVYPELRLPELHYFDKAMTPSFAASIFDRRQLFHLREVLEQWSGEPIDDESLRSAISAENERRRLLGELAAARRAVPSRVSGVTALQIIGASMLMPRNDYNKILRAFLADASNEESRHGPRVFVGGSPLDDDGLYRVIEANGATVVAEDHCWGGRCAELLVDETGDPFETLAERYHVKPACSIRFPISETTAQSLRRANDGAPDAAIFFVYNADGAQNWQVPDQVRGLEQTGVPVLYLANQPYGTSLGEQGLAIQSFLGSLTTQSAGLERLR